MVLGAENMLQEAEKISDPPKHAKTGNAGSGKLTGWRLVDPSGNIAEKHLRRIC